MASAFVENHAPKRQLNLLQVSAIIVGTVIGSGVFISLPIVARIGGSPWMSLLIWVLGGLIWIPQVLVLAEMGTAYPAQGACYVYLTPFALLRPVRKETLLSGSKWLTQSENMG